MCPFEHNKVILTITILEHITFESFEVYRMFLEAEPYEINFQRFRLMGEHEEPAGGRLCRRAGLRVGLARLQQADEEADDNNMPEPRPVAGNYW